MTRLEYTKRFLLLVFVAALGLQINAAFQPELSYIISDPQVLRDLKIPILHEENGAALARVQPSQEREISYANHLHNRCGGYEKIQTEAALSEGTFKDLFANMYKDSPLATAFAPITTANPDVVAALNQVSEQNLRSTIAFLSAFSSRFHGDANPNAHVDQFKVKIEDLIKASGRTDAIVELISHTSTRQKSIHVRIKGASRPSEVMVMGAHLDSINQSWLGSKVAPGADDDASGSANIFEALRILLAQKPMARTLDIFWYAGEEGGLLGSAEIAKMYKSQGQDIVGVLQLDMTLYSGNGQGVIGSMTDFTAGWMRDLLVNLNDIYKLGTIATDQCGYGCSDHASWFRQGFPTLMPFEATMRTMNRKLHTDKDVISTESNFQHSAVYSRLAVALLMELGNASWRG